MLKISDFLAELSEAEQLALANAIGEGSTRLATRPSASPA